MGRLGYHSGPNVITRVKEGGRRVRVRVMLTEKDDRTMLALKMVEDHELRNRESPRDGKGKKLVSLLDPTIRNAALMTYFRLLTARTTGQ